MGLFFLSFCNSFTLLANKYLLTYLSHGKFSEVREKSRKKKNRGHPVLPKRNYDLNDKMKL